MHCAGRKGRGSNGEIRGDYQEMYSSCQTWLSLRRRMGGGKWADDVLFQPLALATKQPLAL